jgi:hypothetical protein
VPIIDVIKKSPSCRFPIQCGGEYNEKKEALPKHIAMTTLGSSADVHSHDSIDEYSDLEFAINVISKWARVITITLGIPGNVIAFLITTKKYNRQ